MALLVMDGVCRTRKPATLGETVQCNSKSPNSRVVDNSRKLTRNGDLGNLRPTDIANCNTHRIENYIPNRFNNIPHHPTNPAIHNC